GLLIKISVLRLFEDRCHICGDGIGPGITVVPGVVTVQMTEIGDERGAWVDWEKDFFKDRVGNSHAVVRHILCVLVVQCKVERRERELAAVKHSRVRKFRVVHLFDCLGWNLFGRIPVIGCERIENLLVPHPVLKHLRWGLYEISRDMRASETAILRTSDNGMQSMAEFVKQSLYFLVRQQGWFIRCWRRKIAKQCHSWSLVLPIRQ